MSPESREHFEIKKIVEDKMREWYGASIDEYYDSGHELDVFAMTSSGLNLYTEVIWHPSLNHLKNDMLILERSDADIKVVITNPEILRNYRLVKEYNKTVISQRNKGVKIWGRMINGERILKEDDFTNIELKQIYDSLIEEFGDDVESYNFEVEMYELIDREGKYEREYDAPLIELFIGSNKSPREWLKPTDLNRWLVSTLPYIIDVIPRRKYFECHTRENDFVRIHTKSIFHLITPMFYDFEHDIYYIDNTFYQIIVILVSCIRLMKLNNIENEHSLIIFLRNIAGINMKYDRRTWHYEYSFSDKINEAKFNFNFIPKNNWSEFKDLLFTIYKEICNELGVVTIQNNIIMIRIYNLMKNIHSYLMQHAHSSFNLVIPRVTVDDFNFTDEEKGLKSK